MRVEANWLTRRPSIATVPRRSSLPKLPEAVLDGAAWLLATTFAFWTALDGGITVHQWPLVLATAGVLAILKLIIAQAFELHRQEWDRFGFLDARNVLLAAGLVTAISTAVVLAVGPRLGIPPAVPIIDGMLSGLLMFATRGTTRHLSERRRSRDSGPRKQRRVLLIGAGEAGSLLAREMLRHPETGMRPVGFIDEDPHKIGRSIATIPVLGRLEDLERVLDATTIDEVLICIPSADGRTVRHIVESIRGARPDMPYRTMPAIYELLSGTVTVNRIREVGIDDLLRRPPVDLHMDSIMSYLHGKRVMITGAGGSIGSELVRQICRFGPGELILFGHGENSIYQLERELERDWPHVTYHSVIAAVQNVQRLDYVFRRYRPDVVFHAAAHKHVPLMELNPEEAVFNNIIGTRNLVQLALKHDISHFVNISTDKAVNPSSVMGASKRMAELIVEDAARDAHDGQTFVSVRFGNVLGSRGSALQVFKDQIRAGGPVTVTHPDMLRYFMTIPEASRLVLQASAQGKNGEIYILDMGEPIRVLDLVKDLIRLSGLEPDTDIPIIFTGIRPGEKLVEELMTAEERQGRTQHDKIFVAAPRSLPRDELERTIELLLQSAMRSDVDAIRRVLSEHITGSTLMHRATEPAVAATQALTASSSLVN